MGRCGKIFSGKSFLWDEYAVKSISAGFTEAYENTFLNNLALADERSNKLILNYRDQLLGEIYGCYGDVLKFAAYHLGNFSVCGVRWQDSEKTAENLKNHWFLPYFERHDAVCQEIGKGYGEWENTTSFTLISDIVDDLVESAGLLIEPMGEGFFG